MVICLLAGLCNAAGAQQVFKLTSLEDKVYTLDLTDISKTHVIFFLSPECPLCQGYALTIRKLFEKYHSDERVFIGVIPGNDFSGEQTDGYQKEFKPMLPLYFDKAKLLTKALNATITPEVFLVKGGKILYSGRIDNWAYEVGKKRKVITAHDLQAALHAITNGQEIKIKKTKAIGCFIE